MEKGANTGPTPTFPGYPAKVVDTVGADDALQLLFCTPPILPWNFERISPF